MEVEYLKMMEMLWRYLTRAVFYASFNSVTLEIYTYRGNRNDLLASVTL